MVCSSWLVCSEVCQAISTQATPGLEASSHHKWCMRCFLVAGIGPGWFTYLLQPERQGAFSIHLPLGELL